MKPLLSTALLVVLGCCCAQAQSSPSTVFEGWSHIDDGIFAGPRKRVPKPTPPPPPAWWVPYTRLPSLKGELPLDFHGVGGSIRPRALTLTQNLRASRASKKTGDIAGSVHLVPSSKRKVRFRV